MAFAPTAAVFSLVILILYALKTGYADPVGSDAHVERYYLYYIHVATMIFTGFGFLMTFLKRYMYGAVGFNFFLSCVCVLWGSLLVGMAEACASKGGCGAPIGVNIPFLINGMFGAGAVMISFGAVIGKLTPTQLLWMTMLELPLFAINNYLLDHVFKVADLGGSMAIHAFGAYFGLTVTLFTSPEGAGSEHPKNGAEYVSDVFSMIGTIFLWILWPSFNAAVAFTGGAAEGQMFRAIINTALSLPASCIAAFIMSALLEKGKFNMVHIQNATLAGGVAVGSSANLVIEPVGAICIGIVAGTLSTIGFARLMPKLEKAISLRDTCGVHNLHGMPGILGGVASAVVALVKFEDNKEIFHHGKASAGYQLAGLAVTLAIAIAGGFLTAFVVLLVRAAEGHVPADKMFEDSENWVTEEEGGEELAPAGQDAYTPLLPEA